MKIRSVLSRALALCGLIVGSAVPSNGAVTIWTQYTASPDKHAKLPNCSYAGYKNGEASLPNPSSPIIDVKTFGAKGDGVADDTTAIRNAINSVGTSGGVVYFPNGTYNCSGVLFVHKNNTILRGQSRDLAKIRFTKSLRDGYAINDSATASMWSWAGGLIWFTPQSKNTYRSSTANMNTDWAGGLDTYRAAKEAWNVGSQITTITSFPVRGDKSFTVSSTSGLSAGQFIFIRVTSPTDNSLLKYLAGNDTWAANYPWANHVRISPSKMPNLDWCVQIASISGSTVTLKQPLRFDLKSAWSPRIMAVGDTIRESGIENLTVVLARNYDWAFSSHHNKEPGWNGPWFNNAINCFLRGVTIVDADASGGVAACKNVTWTDFKLAWSGTTGRRDHHHGTSCRVFSQDCLFENFIFDSEPYHGANVENFSMGNVWHKATMNFGTFDTHRMEPVENIHTDITINNTGLRGGAGDAGPVMGARFVNWNINVRNNVNGMIGNAEEMPYGAIVGVRGCSINSTVHATYGDSKCHVEATGAIPDPVNVYLAQKDLRLLGGINNPPTVSLTSPANGATYSAPATVTMSATASDNGGSISKVEFLAGTTVLATDSSSPYAATWSSVGAGQYSLSAKATDNAGSSTSTSAVTITVSQSSGTVTLNPTADAYVRSGANSSINYGTAIDLVVKMASSTTSNDNRESYLKFNTSAYSGTVNSVKLRLYGALGTTQNTNVRTDLFSVATTSWTETGITWSNKPASGSTALASITVPNTTATWYEIDVTSYVKAERSAGRSTVSFVLKNPVTTSAYTTFHSKEGINKPQLIVSP